MLTILSIRRAALWAAIAMLGFSNASRADEPNFRGQGPGKVKIDLIDDTQIDRFYLGMKLSSVPKSLDAQLQLDGAGVLVTDVSKDGPAGKGGLKEYDVVTAVGDKPIKQLSDMSDAVRKSEGKELALKVMRGGKPTDLTVKPEELTDVRRVFTRRVQAEDERVWDFDVDLIEEKIREKLKDAGVDVRLQLIKPGQFAVGHPLMAVRSDIPEDLSITIRKKGNHPADIEVQKGDQDWKVTEGDLEKLPEEIRPHVLAQLGRGPMQWSVALPGGKQFNVPVPPPVVRPLPPNSVVPRAEVQTRERARGALEHRIEALTRDMEKVQDRMEQLRKELREQADRLKQDALKLEDKGGDEK